MIDNRALLSPDLKLVLLAVVTVLFVLGVLFKRLSDDLHAKLEELEREHGLLKPCPFCGGIPDVRNGCYTCNTCRLVMYIPFRYYKSVKDMVDQTWNKRWKDVTENKNNP